MVRIGLISDTHGLLRPEATSFLRGSDAIIHAGDVCDPAILAELAALAPVTAVRGNCDRGPWTAALKELELLEVGDVRILVCHDLAGLRLDVAQAAVHAVVSGHSHQPKVETRAGILFINPGSAGPRRFRLPISVGELRVNGTSVSAHLQELEVA